MHEKPLSPPLTSPLSTLSLPETRTQSGEECDGCDYESDNDGTLEDGGIMCEDEQDCNTDETQARKVTLSQDGELTLGELMHSEGVRLSPLSPAWKSEMTLVSEDSALLGSSPKSTLAHRRSRCSLVTDHGQPYKRSRSEPYSTPSSPWTPAQGLSENVLLGHEDSAHTPAFVNDQCIPLTDYAPPTPRLTPPREIASSSVTVGTLDDSPPTPWMPWSADLASDASDLNDIWVDGPPSSEQYGSQHQSVPFLESSGTYDAQPASISELNIFAPPQLDDEFHMDVDHGATAESISHRINFSSPPSPFAAASYPDALSPPSSPSISMLPDLSFDDEDHPGIMSPSRRGFNSLPELDMEDALDLEMRDFSGSAPYSSPSPGSLLISLPGVEVDPDLLPPASHNFQTSPPPQHAACSSPSLLFIDDPQDVPFPRSPSPEDFDLRIPIDDDSDPELAKLFNLRKKSVAAERAARHAEAQLIEAGSVCLRAQATKEKRKNKERSKELGALLRIKLGDKIIPEERPRSTTPGGINGISQLVARMLFKRHETFRPMAQRKAGVTGDSYVRSSLSRSTHGFSRADLA